MVLTVQAAKFFGHGSGTQTVAKMFAGLALSMAAVAGMQSAQAQTTVKEGVLTVGTDLTYPPYAYFDNKVPAGFDPDFSHLMAKKLGLKADILDTRFADLVLGLRANRFDMVASALYVTPERAKQIDYVPYLKTGSSLIVLNSSKASPAVPADLCGMKVSTIKAASWTPKLTAVSDTTCKEAGKQPIRIMEFPTSPEALLALKSGAADAMMEDAAVSHQMATEMKDDIKVTSNGLIYPIVIGLGVNKNKPELRDALSKALADARDSGEYQALLDKYGLDAPTAQEIKDSLAPKQ
ncbi:extracellular solute-binding protein [Pusillimonas sp. T7-7]|uniref:ABC transporter substrate-binding protein n=1 Tax=Pusillimonas sp. (strain T7-7) TaxID=1007105 RepID=UPI00020856E0|nr:ABC transporter substrate-binding protein [Pusillimonas sp. T7-7]AEC20853.1 extracellular solute-binding protein [Pusillimonas sp. T7-7]